MLDVLTNLAYFQNFDIESFLKLCMNQSDCHVDINVTPKSVPAFCFPILNIYGGCRGLYLYIPIFITESIHTPVCCLQLMYTPPHARPIHRLTHKAHLITLLIITLKELTDTLLEPLWPQGVQVRTYIHSVFYNGNSCFHIHKKSLSF